VTITRHKGEAARPRCPSCRQPGLRQRVSLFVDCPAEHRSLGKAALRRRDVRIEGTDWPLARLYCPRCGWAERGEGA
jgi:hypothetical protein